MHDFPSQYPPGRTRCSCGVKGLELLHACISMVSVSTGVSLSMGGCGAQGNWRVKVQWECKRIG